MLCYQLLCTAQLLRRDVVVYQEFTAKITGLDDRKQRIKDLKEADKAGGDSKEKGKKGSEKSKAKPKK
jgi:hypothetical protein